MVDGAYQSVKGSAPGQAPRRARFSVAWPVAAALLGFSFNALCSFGKFDALIVLSILPATFLVLISALSWLIVIVRSAARGCWKRTASVGSAAPIAVFCMPGLWSSLDVAAQARLAIEKPALFREIAMRSAELGPRRLRRNWGGTTTTITGGTLCTLVYDEADVLPEKLNAGQPWPSESENLLGGDDDEVERLGGHFYLLTKTVP